MALAVDSAFTKALPKIEVCFRSMNLLPWTLPGILTMLHGLIATCPPDRKYIKAMFA